MDKWIEYAPVIFIVTAFLLRNKIFITPEQANKNYVTKAEFCEYKGIQKAEFNEVKGELKSAVKLLTELSMSVALTAKDVEYIKRAVDFIPKRSGD